MPPRVPSGRPSRCSGLRQPARRGVGGDAGADRRIADRQAADLRRRRHVGLHQRRRHAQHVGDVVEAVARIVAGEQRRGVDRQIEQIANGVGVFGAVEPMERGRARVRAAAAARSSASSTAAANRSSVARSGRGAPAGGIMPVRSLRTTFSQVCGSRPGCSTSSLIEQRDLLYASRALWQVTQ